MKSILERICQNREKEAQWLNTLSLLEFIGSRKISRTVAQNHPTTKVLEHLSDEIRHASIFKKLSLQLNNETDPGYLCKEAAVDYFQHLDQALAEWLKVLDKKTNPTINYLLTTAMIEQRAMTLYPLYYRLTTNNEIKKGLKRIIQEETNHRHFIEEEVLGFLASHQVNDFAEPKKIEDKLFENFKEALRKINGYS